MFCKIKIINVLVCIFVHLKNIAYQNKPEETFSEEEKSRREKGTALLWFFKSSKHIVLINAVFVRLHGPAKLIWEGILSNKHCVSFLTLLSHCNKSVSPSGLWLWMICFFFHALPWIFSAPLLSSFGYLGRWIWRYFLLLHQLPEQVFLLLQQRNSKFIHKGV